MVLNTSLYPSLYPIHKYIYVVTFLLSLNILMNKRRAKIAIHCLYYSVIMKASIRPLLSKLIL